MEGSSVYELIDGMQRLNAIFAFLENEYSVDGHYFDLDALADTKLKKDSGDLVQKTPVLGRAESAAVANYSIALSVYRADQDESVDEVFRRINSGGRSLSRQGLRAGRNPVVARRRGPHYSITRSRGHVPHRYPP